MALAAIYAAQLIFHILDVAVNSRLSSCLCLIHPGEPLLLMLLVPIALVISLIFLPLLGLVSASVFEGHQAPPSSMVKISGCSIVSCYISPLTPDCIL